jgi:hypothetical protein
MPTALTPTTFTDNDYVSLQNVFAGGDISKASRPELERFAVMLSRPRAYTHFGERDFPQICETVRTLILVRMSEEVNREATHISKIALYIAIAALVAGMVQAVASIWQR